MMGGAKCLYFVETHFAATAHLDLLGYVSAHLSIFLCKIFDQLITDSLLDWCLNFVQY